MFWLGFIVALLLVGGVYYGKAYLTARATGKSVLDVLVGR